jgi:hypothetical protein
MDCLSLSRAILLGQLDKRDVRISHTLADKVVDTGSVAVATYVILQPLLASILQLNPKPTQD